MFSERFHKLHQGTHVVVVGFPTMRLAGCGGICERVNCGEREERKAMKHLPLKKAYGFAAANGIENEAQKIKQSDIRWKSYTSSIRRAFIIDLFRKRGLFDKFKNAHWRVGSAEQEKATERYRKIKDGYEKSR